MLRLTTRRVIALKNILSNQARAKSLLPQWMITSNLRLYLPGAEESVLVQNTGHVGNEISVLMYTEHGFPQPTIPNLAAGMQNNAVLVTTICKSYALDIILILMMPCLAIYTVN